METLMMELILSGRKRGDILQRVTGCDEGDGPEPHGGRAEQHGDGG